MKTALIVHPYLGIWAGGELLALYVMRALVEDRYRVKLFSDTNDYNSASRIYPEAASILKEVEWIRVPKLKTHRKFLPPIMRMIWASFNDRRISQILNSEKFDIVFQTQSTVFPTDNSPTVHFTYDPMDLFSISPYSGGAVYQWRPEIRGFSRSQALAFARRGPLRTLVRRIMGMKNPQPTLIASPSVKTEQTLRRRGFHNVQFFIPAARRPTPLPKKRQIIQVSRLVSAKRVEWFLEAARQLPWEKFVLIGRVVKDEEEEYGKRLVQTLPLNVRFINGSLSDNLDRLRESSVYLHTGNEPAMMLTVAEGVSAGCCLLAPRESGSYEVIKKVSGKVTGFSSFKEMIQKLQALLDATADVEAISSSAEPFSVEHFKAWVKAAAWHIGRREE